MKKSIFLSILMLFTLALPSMSQEVATKKNDTTTVVREGNVFRANKVSNGRQSQEGTKTEFTYEDRKGKTYPIYLSASGKAYIKVVSQKTGKEYRRYLPEIGRQINPKAYEETNKKD